MAIPVPPANKGVADAHYTYDAEGNLTGQTGTPGSGRRYLWDTENRLVAIENIDDPTTRSEFAYDALGRRIGLSDSENGIVVQDLRLVYCGTALCAKADRLTGAVTRYYPEGESQAGIGRYYHRDHLGSVRAVSDDAGSLKAAYAYDPWGRRTTPLGNPAEVDFGYTGHFTHHPTGLALAPYRAYDPDLGRWISRDPIGEEGGLNLHAYVDNNPLNWIDPSGLTAVPMPVPMPPPGGQSTSIGGYDWNAPFWPKWVRDLVTPQGLDTMYNSNKGTRKKIDGLQGQIDKHKEKIHNNPDSDAVNRWEKEIKAWQDRIDKLKKRLPGCK